MDTAINRSPLILYTPRPVDQNAAAVYIAGLSKGGQRTQAQALRTVAGMLGTDVNHLDWGRIRYQHTTAIRERLAQSYAPATANKILSALRQTLRQAWLLGQMTAEDYHRAVEIKPITGQTLPAGRELSSAEILALMEACQADPTPAGARDAAIIGMMYAAGLRRDEMVSLNLSDYDPDAGRLVLTGKRNKQRTTYITNGAADALNDWIALRGPQPGALFVGVSKSGKVLVERETMIVKPFRNIGGVEVPNKKAGMTIYRGGAMTPQAIYNMLVKRTEEAGVKPFSPHDLRSSFISHLLDKGADIAIVSYLDFIQVKHEQRCEESENSSKEVVSAMFFGHAYEILKSENSVVSKVSPSQGPKHRKR